MRVYALKLVHDSADDLHAVRHLDAESFFYAVAQCVAVHMRRKVVQTVGKGQCLGIRFGFAKFFYTTVYIAAVYVYLLYYLAVQRYAEMKHTVRSWVLRAYVDYIFFLTEYRFFLFHGIAGSVFHIFFGSVLAVLAFKCKRILRRIVILAQGDSP